MTKMFTMAPDQVREMQQYEKEVTVMVWRNHGGVTGADHAGHAAVFIRMRREVDMYKTVKFWIRANESSIATLENQFTFRYFSFWPGGEGVDGLQSMVTKQDGRFTRSYFDDMVNELGDSAQQGLGSGTMTPYHNQRCLMVSPDKKAVYGVRASDLVHLPVQQPGFPPSLGLNTYLMCQAANAFRNSDHFAYLMASKTSNCAGVAVRILNAGGAGAFCAIPEVTFKTKHAYYMTPNDVTEFATAVDTAIFRLNNMLTAFWQHVGVRAHTILTKAKFQGDNPLEIYTKDIWKKRSSVAFKTRGKVLQDIDTQIGNYHKYKWDNSFEEKLKALCILISKVYKHTQISKSGKRDDAFTMLMYQIVMVVKLQVMENKTTTRWPLPLHYGRTDK